MKKILLLVCVMALFSVTLLVGDAPEFITFEVWVEGDPFIPGTDYVPLMDDDIHRALLEEARWVAGGMVYGFRVHYIIGDRARGLEERFSMEPVGRVAIGDQAFRVIDARTEGTKAYARVRYDLQEHQRRWVRRFSGVEIRRIQSSGEGPLFLGAEGRMNSYHEAVKAGIRGMLQAKERNRPREIYCTVLLEAPPRTMVDAGSYRSHVRMRVAVHDLVPHTIY